MILYVNGDSHSAGAQAVNDYAFANDDFSKVALGKKPHPENLKVSYGSNLSNFLKLALVCDAEAGCSNERIIRTTYDYLNKKDNKQKTLIVIGWTNWTRTEWFDEDLNELIQINASFENSATPNLLKKFKHYVAKLNIVDKQIEWNDKIYQLHLDLNELNIPHLFFNGNNHFGGLYVENRLHLPIIPNHYDWGRCYIDPYSSKGTYSEILKSHGFSTVSPNSWHFGKDAHCFWADYMLAYIERNQLFR